MSTSLTIPLTTIQIDFPTEMPVSFIDRRNPEYDAHFQYFERLRKLYEGGQTMDDWASDFLMKRAMEPMDVYSDRLQRFVYVNHLGNIIGWYVSALFKEPPQIVLRKNGDDSDNAIKAAESAAEQLAVFQDNCDGGGRSLTDFWQQEIEPKLLLYKKAYLLFDLQKSADMPTNRAAQDASGALMGHLVAYAPQDIINWETDAQGNLIWAILKVRVSSQPSPFQPPVMSDRWYVYTKTLVAAYEVQLADDAAGNPILSGNNQYGTHAIATMMPGYPSLHALSDQNLVPLFIQSIHHNHWIADRVSSPLRALLLIENGFNWSLDTTNLAMLVLFTKSDLDKVTRSESSWLKLDPGDRAEFLEQSGAAFAANDKRIEGLREEIYRLAYLIDQGKSSSATASSQSGRSKEQDKMPARDILSALGDRDRGAIQKILQIAADRQGLDVTVDVQGFDFSDRSEMVDLEVIEKAATIMAITSTTLERDTLKKIARILDKDANRETLEKIDAEIDAAPTPTEAEQAATEQNNAMQLQKITGMATSKAFSNADSA